MAKRSNPYDVKLSPEAAETLRRRLCDAVRFGLQARSNIIEDNGAIDFAYSLYEQQPQRGISRDTNRYGGADLTSPIGTQMVDTLTEIAGKTIFVQPFWIVEGESEEDAQKAPVVEEYMHLRFEEMRGQLTASMGIQQSLVEEGAILEACEDAMEVYRCDVVKAKLLRDDLGSILFDKKGLPQPMLDEAGDPVPATADAQGAPLEEFVEVKHSYTDVVRRGATSRLHSLKDFLFLPSHARDARELWGYAWRFWMPLDELTQAAEHGLYDVEAVEQLGTHQERENRAENDRTATTVQVDHSSDKVEKELWRIQMYADLGKGMGFYIVTLSLQHEQILSVRHDWAPFWRCDYMNPYPRPYSIYGYSMILNKLLTTIEGHTAWRNMNADRGLLKANAPLKRLHGAQWDPTIQPFGAGETIDVGDMNEIQPFEFEDVSAHAFQREREFYEEAARIIGISDILASVNPKVSRTLGENEMVTEQSFTRTEGPIRRLQEAFEGHGEKLHAIEVKMLEESEQGIVIPAHIRQALAIQTKGRYGGDTAMRVTADMIRGKFRFKPRGSVETADPNRRMNNFVGGVKVMGLLAQSNPALAARYSSPQVADALNQEFVDIIKPRDKQAFLAPLPAPPMPPMLPPGPGAPSPEMGGNPMMPPQLGGDAVLQQLMSSLPAGGVQ